VCSPRRAQMASRAFDKFLEDLLVHRQPYAVRLFLSPSRSALPARVVRVRGCTNADTMR
jgi:hypothetical protein